MILFRDMLKRNWEHFKASLGKSILLVIAGAVLMQIVVIAVRALIPVDLLIGQVAEGSAVSVLDLLTASWGDFVFIAFASLGPLAIVMIEEFVFRHTLLVTLPVWSNKLFAVLVIIVNGILFGLIHINNFDGNVIATIPYMAVGLFFSCVYLWTRNIWHVMLMHFLNNFFLAFGGLFFLLVARLLGIFGSPF